MHEGNFTQEIVESIFSEIQKFPSGKPSRVRVVVGEVFHLEPESVTLHFQRLTQGTRLEGVHLELIEMPVMVKCRSCQEEGQIEDHHLMICPACFSNDVEVLQGQEVFIESIQMEDSLRIDQ